MTLSTFTGWSAGQQLALAQLERIAAADQSVRIAAARPPEMPDAAAEVDLSVDCSDLHPADGGVRLRRREQITIQIPAAFPFAVPYVRVRHTRFADVPHVNWAHQLCMYRSPSIEYEPADGMYGFVTRVLDWFKAAAAGELDGPGEPIHPPYAHPDPASGLLVVRADAPTAPPGGHWVGAAVLHQVRNGRADVVGWLPFDGHWPLHPDQAAAQFALPPGAQTFLAPVIVSNRELTFHYPGNADDLLQLLARDNLTATQILGLLAITAHHNRILSNGTAPLYLVLGTPSRGIAGRAERRTHLVAWHLPDVAERVAAPIADLATQNPDLNVLGRALDQATGWLATLPVGWTRVNEMRPEVTVRRDTATPAAWLHGKKILVLGCGAIGAPTAEACVRAGAARVVVADHATVHPGILARQSYTDADIGYSKAHVLAHRLRQITPETTIVHAHPYDITTTLDSLAPHAFDLILDCTADRIVRAHLEAARLTVAEPWPHLATVMIGHQATRGIAAVSPKGTTGGGLDVLRRTALTARAHTDLADFVDDFFPTQPHTELFQPEPGCSDATFTGSTADVTGLAGQLMTGILHALRAPAPTMSALLVRMPAGPNDPPATPNRWLTWPDDATVTDETGGYQVRISPAALAEMRAETRRGARVRGPRVETGGTLLGAVDDATRIIWIDEVTGPPPDSLLSEMHFEHGTYGTKEHIAARSRASGGISRFLGMWHTHPHGPAHPSPTDTRGMAELTTPVDGAPPRALILIAGGPTEHWNDWITTGRPPHWYAALVDRADTGKPPGPGAHRSNERPQGRIIWWPGGYATSPLTGPHPNPGPRTRK